MSRYFLSLTLHTGQAIRVNLDAISAYHADSEGDPGAWIKTPEWRFAVSESIDTIDAMVNQACKESA